MMVDTGGTFCNLVGTLVHEKAHADRMPKGKHHNEPLRYPEAFKDKVYRMGDAATSRTSVSAARTATVEPVRRARR